MTAALTKALEVHDPAWMRAGLERSYLRTIGGVMYAVIVAANGDVLAVYRVSRRRMNVQLAEFWPRELVEELTRNPRPADEPRDDARLGPLSV